MQREVLGNLSSRPEDRMNLIAEKSKTPKKGANRRGISEAFAVRFCKIRTEEKRRNAAFQGRGKLLREFLVFAPFVRELLPPSFF